MNEKQRWSTETRQLFFRFIFIEKEYKILQVAELQFFFVKNIHAWSHRYSLPSQHIHSICIHTYKNFKSKRSEESVKKKKLN